MRVFHPTRKAHSLFVAPAADPRAQSGGIDADWLENDGAPKSITVNFDAEGKAYVPDALGRYLIATGQATGLWLPRFLLAA
jgi:hypothetical protein